MGKLGITELLVVLLIIAGLIFIGRAITLWYFKINERITQQHETNRLLRKLAGEPELQSTYINSARNSVHPTVSTAGSATQPLLGQYKSL